MQLLYKPRTDESGSIDEPMRVMVFFSGGASSMKYMLENDPNHGKLYKVVAAFTDKQSAEKGIGIAKDKEVPVIILDRKTFYQEKNLNPKVFDNRKFYYEQVCRDIEQFDPDIIALSGYMHIVSDPLLSEHESHVFNVHPAPLHIFRKAKEEFYIPFEVFRAGEGGIPSDVKSLLEIIKKNGWKRAYTGPDAVTLAVLNGEEYTRATVHILTKEVDGGPILVQSKKFPVKRKSVTRKLREWNIGAVADYARDDLQDEMKWGGDGPTYAKALELTSKGRLAIDDFTVSLDMEELPYYGFRIGE
ncbi:MAG: hypothetical protein GTN76_07980 [Candidatus Aenigmarchaeota archaeon]|nr:hypothetical protein [Candidatus Aenigmarchaeota archaeon]